MDPDEALRLALTQPGEPEGKEAAIALVRWLSDGGFAPREEVVSECGVTGRRQLPHPHDHAYLERYGSGWAITYKSHDHDWKNGPTIYVRLRRA